MNKSKKSSVVAAKKGHQVQSPGRFLQTLIAVAIILITYTAFAPVLNGTFTNWDDDTYVIANAMVRANSINWKTLFSEPVALNYHPLTIFSFILNHQAAGFHPHAYIATNLLLHLLNSVLVYLFFYFLSGKKKITAGIAGLLFGIHPMHVESVAWISERKDVLYVFFLLLSMIAYLRYRENQKITWLMICFLLFVLSCLSKAMAVVLPVLLLLIDYYQKRILTRNVWLEKTPFLLLSLFFGVLALRIQSGSSIETIQSFSFLQQFFFGCYGCIIYLVKFLVPYQLSAFYPYPVTTSIQSMPLIIYCAPFILLAASWLVFHYLRKQSVIVFGLLFFLVSIILVLQFITVGNTLMADRYSYLSYAGLSFIAGYGFEKVYTEKRSARYLLIIVTFIVLASFAYFTHERTKVWNTSETLWTDVINKYPLASTAYKNRGNYYGEKGNSTAALKDYNVLLSMHTVDPEVFNNLGNIYANENKLAESVNAYTRAIELKSDYANAYVNRGISYNSLKQPQKAADDFSKAISLRKQDGSLWAQRGYTYFLMSNFEPAIADFNQAVTLQPDNAAVYYCRGLCYNGLGKKKEALNDLRKARSMGYEGDYSLLNH